MITNLEMRLNCVFKDNSSVSVESYPTYADITVWGKDGKATRLSLEHHDLAKVIKAFQMCQPKETT